MTPWRYTPVMPALRIAAPCSASWTDMPGNDKVRHCPQCKLDVYNLSEMTPLEINQIVVARTGRLCARFYQRADGMMLTKNCPVGFRAAILRASRMAVGTLAALVTIAPAKTGAIPAQSARLVLTANTHSPGWFDAASARSLRRRHFQSSGFSCQHKDRPTLGFDHRL